MKDKQFDIKIAIHKTPNRIRIPQKVSGLGFRVLGFLGFFRVLGFRV